jgi:hypothetical protein
LGQREVSERRATPVIELGFGIVRGLAAIEEIKEGEGEGVSIQSVVDGAVQRGDKRVGGGNVGRTDRVIGEIT